MAGPSRAAAVLNIHFSRILDVPAVSDGYVVYNMLPVRQRCWVHLLREAEECAVRNGGSDTSYYCRLLSIYRTIKGQGVGRQLRVHLPGEGRSGDSLILPGGPQVQDQAGGGRPYLFTFLRYPGMPPHNNGAELEIRDTAVLHRNVRHQLSTTEERDVFSVLVSVARTCRKLGIFPADRGGVPDQGSGLEAVQAAVRAGTPGTGRAVAVAC